LSFNVQKGEVLFIKGPSGVGKSLLLRALAHLDRPTVSAAGRKGPGGLIDRTSAYNFPDFKIWTGLQDNEQPPEVHPSNRMQ
jgi:energy-coupling factor transporter ATP-binding protein EcfA2